MDMDKRGVFGIPLPGSHVTSHFPLLSHVAFSIMLYSHIVSKNVEQEDQSL
jgi:hypothetical protein